MSTTWEYRVEAYALMGLKDVSLALNASGREGWELVTIVANVLPNHHSGFAGHFAVFKKPFPGSN